MAKYKENTAEKSVTLGTIIKGSNNEFLQELEEGSLSVW